MSAQPLSPAQRRPQYGSDVVVDLLHRYGIEYAACNPGASFRGLHDSVVNYGTRSHQALKMAMLACCSPTTL